MIIPFLRIWMLDMKKSISGVLLFETLVEYSIYFIFINTISKNPYLSSTLLFLIIFFKYTYKNIYIFRQAILSGKIDGLLLKPVNPIYRTLIEGINLIDLVIKVLIIVILAITFPSHIIVIISTLVFLFSLHLLFQSLALFVKDKLSVEKILPLVILVFLTPILSGKTIVSLDNLLAKLSTLLFSVSLLFISIKLWNLAIKKYL